MHWYPVRLIAAEYDMKSWRFLSRRNSFCSHSPKHGTGAAQIKAGPAEILLILKGSWTLNICLLISCRNGMFQRLILSSSTENERNCIEVFGSSPIRLDKKLLQLKKALQIKYCTQRDLHPLPVNCWDSHIFLPILETKTAPLFLIQTSLKGSLILKQIDNILLCNSSYFQGM